ncbi:MAG: M20 family metallopeptidase [Pyrinomonadaceae bacterium]
MPSEIFHSRAQEIRNSFSETQVEIIALINALVEAESPSGDETGSREVVALLAQATKSLNCVSSIETIDVPNFGQHLVISAFNECAGQGNILLVGHTDTVHSRGSLAANPWRITGNRIYGPGIYDMKANCVLAIEALRTLERLQIKPDYGVTLVLTCDEEVGSFTGWPLLERLGREARARCALVLEPSAAGGCVKTARKGTGMFTMTTQGRAAHAGLEPGKGASAILELAKQIERLHAMNNSGNGISVNVGVVQGGTRSNVVAAEATAEIDVRFSTEAESREIVSALLNSVPFDDRVRVHVTGGINRPPLERTAQVEELYVAARGVAKALDFELGEAHVGGASDGNFLAAMGIPVLDGLGIDGDGAHAINEHILADAIPRRGALIAGLIVTL